MSDRKHKAPDAASKGDHADTDAEWTKTGDVGEDGTDRTNPYRLEVPDPRRMASTMPTDLTVDRILAAADPEDNSFESFGLELKLHEPSLIRRTYYKLSLKVHPDKNDHSQSKEAFQKLTNAFEILYDLERQTEHLEHIRLEKSKQEQQDTKEAARDAEHKAKRRKTKHDWKEERRKKKEQQNQQPQWAERKWEDVVKELRRREQLEQEFRQRHSNARLEKRIQGMIWHAMRVCRALDEKAGCPPTFVNGLWAPLYEQEVFREHSPLPQDWEWAWDKTVEEQQLLQQARRRVYRNVVTGEETK